MHKILPLPLPLPLNLFCIPLEAEEEEGVEEKSSMILRFNFSQVEAIGGKHNVFAALDR
jgi:hypothetical protein